MLGADAVGLRLGRSVTLGLLVVSVLQNRLKVVFGVTASEDQRDAVIQVPGFPGSDLAARERADRTLYGDEGFDPHHVR